MIKQSKILVSLLIMHQILTKNALAYQYLLTYTKELFIRMSWQKNINYEIIDNLKESKKYYPEGKNNHKPQGNSPKVSYYLLLVKILRKLYLKPKGVNILKSLERLQQ